MFSSLLELVLLVTALSLDAFAASFVYGVDQVKIPKSSILIICLLSTSILLFFLYIGKGLAFLIPSGTTRLLCFFILFGLGLIKFFDGSVKNWIKKHPSLAKKLHFSFAGLCFILTIYADPSIANGEDVSVLSPTEAVSLGLALSLDSAAAGLGAGMISIHFFPTLFLSLFTCALAVYTGSWLGKKLAVFGNLELSWLGGAMLMLLACLKLF